MQREKALAGAIVTVVAVSLFGALLVPGVIATGGDSEPAEAESSSVSFTELTVQPTEVSGATATFAVDMRLSHRGAETENLSVEYRAVDRDTGMVETTVREELDPVEGDREVAVTTNVSVEREGDYRLETIVYRDGRRAVEGYTRLDNVGSLTPAYADTPVQFHRFGGELSTTPLPVIEYSVEEAEGDRVRLDVSTYLTNTGDEAEDDLRVVLLARQSDSNVIADRQSVDVDRLGAGESATPGATLTVPDEYNYHLDAVLWHDGVIVSDARETALLDPTREVPENETEEEVEFSSDDFSADEGSFEEAEAAESGSDGSGTGSGDSGDRVDDAADGDGQPGFGVAAGLAALAGALVAAV